MMHASEIKHDKKSGRRLVKHPGITAAARRLGVNRSTLYKMLAGYPGFSNLRTLRRRYETLMRKGAAR
jgi:hypothetical protein